MTHPQVTFPWQPLDTLIDLALEEDLGHDGDVTTRSTMADTMQGSAVLIAKSDGILAGLPVFERVFNRNRNHIEIITHYQDGDLIQKGDCIGELSGALAHILMFERIALNFVQHCSGIATETWKLVQTVRDLKCQILDTRKTTPGFRWLDKYSVYQGGGKNHRTGLFDMILIKDNHIEAAGGIDAVLTRCFQFIENQKQEIPVEIEVKNIAELNAALKYPVQRIMLDNMSVPDMQNAVAITDGRVELEASGNVTLKSLREIAETGVDFVSVGAITHSAPAFDFSLLVSVQKTGKGV